MNINQKNNSMEKEFKILLDIVYDLAIDNPEIQDRLEKLAVRVNETLTKKQ